MAVASDAQASAPPTGRIYLYFAPLTLLVYLVLHDTDLPQWGPVFDAVTQLALSAPPSGVHSVWIDGVQVIDDGRATLIDGEKLLADARAAGAAIIERTGLPTQTAWAVA